MTSSADPGLVNRAALARRVGEAIYGTIVVLTVVDYLVEDHDTPVEAVVTVVGSACVLFLARLYAEALAERAALPQPGSLRRIASSSWPVAAAGGPPAVPLLVAATGAITVETALDAASLICIAGLGVSGYAAARLTHAGHGRRLASTALTLLVGLVIVGLKESF